MDVKNKRSISLRISVLLVIIVCAWHIRVNAQAITGSWGPILKLYEVDTSQIYEPVVLSDTTGQIHVFWLDEERSIYYTVKTGTGWSEPVDIVAQASPFSVAVDTQGYLHLVWTASDMLFYSQSSISEASSVRTWTSPQPLVGARLHAHIVVDTNDKLHVVYPTPGGSAVSYIFSGDSGITWSLPVEVSIPLTPDGAMGDTRLAVGDNGDLHLVWTEYELPNGWPPLGVFYTSSTDAGLTWRPPFQVAGPGYDEITVALGSPNTIHLAWNGMAGIAGRYHRWSSDGGHSWSEINIVTASGGTEGFPNFAIDSDGQVHLLITTGVCARYSGWQDFYWTEPICVPPEEANSFKHVEEASMAISEGNQLHVVFWDDRQRLWYTTMQTAAPSIASVDPNLMPPAPYPIVVIEVTPTATPQTTIDPGISLMPESDTLVHSGFLLVLSILPVVFLVGGVVWAKLYKGKNRGL